MVSKIQAAKKAGAAGLPTLIANGLTIGILEKIFSGQEVGTLFLPQDQKLTSRQYWLAYNVTPKGAILVDPGARTALVQGHKSLLSPGILEVFGGFRKGDAVHLTLRGGPHQLLGEGDRPDQGPPIARNRPIPGPQGLRRGHS
jgi:glutamate 5-kinase